ncbi:MAG: hypothetical protein AAB337_01030 [Patescibacteria group bacterium]
MVELRLNQTDLERAIFRTVAWFSLFEFPVTSFEIWKWLIEPLTPYRLEQVTEVLETSDWLFQRVEREGGFFILSNVRELTALRHRRFIFASRKYHCLQRALIYLSRIPSIRAVIACNTLAWSNTKSESDIDLFVITRAGTLWLTRLLTIAPFALFGRRPATGVIDPFCFSFFVSETHRDFSSLRLHKSDLYLAQWIRSCVPLFDHGLFEYFVHENGWVNGLFPNSFGVRLASARRVYKPTNCHAIGKRVGRNIFESLARILQRRRLPSELQSVANLDTRVIVTDDMLKFHPNDRREEFLRRWKAICLSV